MQAKSLLILTFALAACAPNPNSRFTAADSVGYTLAEPGTIMTATTLKGKVRAYAEGYPNLTVAAVGILETIAATRVSGETYSLPLPAQPKYESDTTYGYHEIWELVLFNDKNGNGEFDYRLEGDQASERDTPIATYETYRLGYKGYTSTNKTPVFLPHNAFEKGWVIVFQRAGINRQFHQDFTRDFNFTETNYSGTDNISFE